MATDLKRIASLLLDTMTNAGIMDDYDEIIGDVYDNGGLEAATTYHEDVLHALEFINEQLDEQYNTSREVDDENPYTWHQDYLRAIGEIE